ncbi:MdtA/MuxA family multidrug efflux RND transporter periplasmic adaptor subunit [Advenella alkanexedens]|jgi:multidrug efflux system membrane fusion protein|uniref:MdtA/MuxA family multidrug efflux RND transporter periplasmic adaptor subunit n=1 Tax=Advenella alkanexedens TaxID=1481665 RepID=A0ABS6NL77_9BURK|nr:MULTISPECIES: MdtA/MuxA family multidrug efflux RND transporter periplasmic adaptor subunit [Advenella]MBV4396384.1 MdtA/MuxA family multidrug efflux RND transporter periplasmic adaptor subunit [Advenella alkanexedens]MDD3757572.1 MdtA/MuxA family multidrug efflux RND transporter periplasmic adaptor subunit [Advenella sp.]NLN66837.1 MdtA/MuxA family multidrug efflux RND transporter periplasmic adaptor subunit [Alcaligenaceae bacterium]
MANQTQENVPKTSKRLQLAIFVLIVIGGYYGWQYFSNDPSGDNATTQSQGAGGPPLSRNGPGAGARGAMVTPVRVETVQQKDMEVRVPGLGTVTAFNTVGVRSQVSGPIVNIAFTEGQEVKQGDLLFEIDPRPFQIQLQQAQGQQARNAAELANARQDLKRYQTLFKQDSIARQQVDTQAALVQRLEAQAYSDKAAVDEAKLNLEYTKVLAPIDGRLGLRNVDIGNLVTANSTDALVSITQVKPISVVFSMPEIHLAEVATQYAKGAKLEVTLMDRDNRQELATGELVSMDNLVDVSTGTIKLKANFSNEDERLFPNQFVNTRLKIRQVPQAMVISTDAIQNSSNGPFLFRVGKDNTAEMVPVKLGVTDGIYTQILEGVALGEQIITEGVDRLRNGSKIEIIQ